MLRRSLAPALLALGLALQGCSCGPDGAVKVVAHFEGLTPGCVTLTATESGGKSSTVKLLRAQLSSPTQAVIGVTRLDGWSNTLALELAVYEGACTGTPLDTQNKTVTLVSKQVETWEATFTIADADHDGFAPTSAGGTDCDDANPNRNPGIPELCSGTVDLNCNGQVGCADPMCTAKVCDDGNGCTTGDVCRGDGGCVGTSVVCNAPPNGCYQAMGACGADGGCEYTVNVGYPCTLPDGGSGGGCRSDGSCATGEANCADGIDNDSDGKTDCADTDCSAQSCSDGDPCTVGDTCTSVSASGCVGTAMTCTTPPAGPCFNATGACVNGSCRYSGNTSKTCDDGNPCTTGEQCRVDGGCSAPTGTKSCNTPPNASCYGATGICNTADGGCDYTALGNGTACDDGVACTAGDVCTSGSCGGTAFTCANTQCTTSASCLADGGCGFTPKTGACDAGTGAGQCASGGCVAKDVFPYAPANFNPTAHVPVGPVNLSCAAFVDTSGTNPVWDAGCVPASQVNFDVADGGAGTLVTILAVKDFTITASGSLTVTGNRPLIIAVYGDANFDGPIYANTVRTGPNRAGPGSRNATECGTQAGANAAGGGGGGGGAAYSVDGASGGNTTGTEGGAGGQLISGGDVPLRGGCPGGDSQDTGGNSVNTNGVGGGAVQVSAAWSLRVNDVVTASGGGGNKPNTNNAGGGGGGSGGVVRLEGYQVVLTGNAALTANGGGGGGATNGNPSNATAGADGSTSSATPANGGAGEGGGGAGGKGGATVNPTAGVTSTNSSKGGGGGGGAQGRIVIRQVGPAGGTGSCFQALESPVANRTNCP